MSAEGIHIHTRQSQTRVENEPAALNKASGTGTNSTPNPAEPTAAGLLTLRISRFAPHTGASQSQAQRSGSPFATRRSNPFASRRSPFAARTSTNRIRGRHWTQEYSLRVHGNETILDCLLEIQRHIDPTLAFRHSCGHGICGADAVTINGTAALLCTSSVAEYAVHLTGKRETDASGFRRTATENDDGETPQANIRTPQDGCDIPDYGIIEIKPLAGFTVLRDLIVDTDRMMNQIRSLKPYLESAGHEDHVDKRIGEEHDMVEHLQRPEKLERYERLTNCISCGICEASCPVYSGGEAFVGPAALITASRFINDSRDGQSTQRLQSIQTNDGINACQSIRACSRPCPQGIDVGEEIWRLVTEANERQ